MWKCKMAASVYVGPSLIWLHSTHSLWVHISPPIGSKGHGPGLSVTIHDLALVAKLNNLEFVTLKVIKVKYEGLIELPWTGYGFLFDPHWNLGHKVHICKHRRNPRWLPSCLLILWLIWWFHWTRRLWYPSQRNFVIALPTLGSYLLLILIVLPAIQAAGPYSLTLTHE